MPWLEDLKFPRGYQMGTHISKLADERMYQNKKDYYTTSCNDRRR